MNASPNTHVPCASNPAQTHDPGRREPRREGLRQADISPFPRISIDTRDRLGLLLNESDAGLCLIVAKTEAIGSLLRVRVRGLHGHTSRDIVARVVWCESTKQGRFRLGLALLRETQPQMLRVRYWEGQRMKSVHKQVECPETQTA